MQVEVFHLFHSGTAVRVNKRLFIFDYFKDDLDKNEALKSSLENGMIGEDSFNKIEKAYVFVSHSHYDHYNSVIFEWEKYCDDITYFLADEIDPEIDIAEKNNLYLMAKDQEIDLTEIKVKALGSTDKGVSFLVDYADLSIFHAGDLNWWKWKRFSSKVQKKEEDDYKREVDKLQDKVIDIAFVPVDPRLEENYYLAGEYFINTIKPGLFIPIHFAENYDVTKFFKDKMNSDQTRVAEITIPGHKLLYTKK